MADCMARDYGITNARALEEVYDRITSGRLEFEA